MRHTAKRDLARCRETAEHHREGLARAAHPLYRAWVQFRRDDSTGRDSARTTRAPAADRSVRALRVSCLVFVVVNCPASLWAQGSLHTRAGSNSAAASSRRPPHEAVEHYERGRQFYLEGRYRDALVELKAALNLDPTSADLLYNVARVYENLRMFDEAIAYYQRYEERLTRNNIEERDKTDKTIRRLQGAKHELELQGRQEAALTAQNGEAVEPARRMDVVFWLAGGAAVGLLSAGAVTGILALKTTDDVGAFVVGPDGSLGERDHLVRRADRFALATDVLLAAGAVALTGAVLLYLLRAGEPELDTSDHSGARDRSGARQRPAARASFDGLRLRVVF